MDLPPPPPSFRHHNNHHLRYENVLRPPYFIPQPYPHNLPPPPPPSQIRSLNLPLPPPPSPPPPLPLLIRHMSPTPHPPSFAFSPPRYPIIERTHRCEFDPPAKPYSHHTLLPPPPPRENIPLRIVHEYPKRNPVYDNENYSRGRIDDKRELPENWDRDLRRGATGVHSRGPKADRWGRDSYRDVIPDKFELYRKRDDDRIWDSGLSDWGSDLDRRRDYDERRWDSGRNDRMYRECDYDERRWDSGMNDRSPDLYRDPSFDERRWDNCMNNQGHEVYIQVDDDEMMRRDSSRSAGVLSRLGNRQPELSEDDLRFGRVLSRLGNRPQEYADDGLSFGGVLSRLGNRQPEFADNNPNLGRFSGRLGTGVSGGLVWPDKKKRLQKKNTLPRNPLRKIRSRHNGGFKTQHFANESGRSSFKVKEEGSAKMQTRMEVKREREQSPMELAISFNSNALVAKAIEVPSHPATELRVRSNSVKEIIGYNASALPADKQDVVSDYQFVSQETSPEYMDKGGTKQPLLGADSLMERDDHAIKVVACKPLVPKRKRKRSNLNRRHALKRKRNNLSAKSALSYAVHSVITKCSSRVEGSLTTTENADLVHQLRADGVAQQAHENFLSQENAGCGESLVFNQDVNISNKYVHDKTSVCDADREGEVSVHPNLDETMQMKEDAITSGVGVKDANSEYFLPNHADTPQVTSDANHFRSLEGAAVTECPNFASDISVSSCVLSANNKETLPEFESSFSDNVGTVLLHNVYSVEESPKMTSGRETGLSIDNSSPKVMSNKETCVSVGHSSKVIRKRKHRGAQMDLSGTKTNVNVETVRIIDDGITRCLPEDFVPAMDGDFVGERDGCKDVLCISKKVNCFQEGPSGAEISDLEVQFTANGSFPGYHKKQKLSSPRLSLTYTSEDNTIADGFSNWPILEQYPTRPSDLRAEQSGDTSSASITITQCQTTDVRGEVSIKDLNVANRDENLVDGDRLLGSDDLGLIASGISNSDRNGPTPSDSGDELLASSFDMQSCMSSPEGLHVYSDPCFLGNTKTSACLTDTEMICQSEKISNKKNVFADPNTSSLGKCLVAAVNKSQSIPRTLQSIVKDTSQVVKKLYPVHGKLTWSKDQVPSAVTKVFPVHHPLNFSNTRKSYDTKSRTWCRTVDPTAAVMEPKVKAPIPQSNATKAARPLQSSYIRKGNSLVRKHSPLNDASHGFPSSSCSVNRLSPCTNTKKNDLASECKTGGACALTLKRTGQVNTFETTKALTQNRNGNSLSCSPCNLEEPLPVSNPHRNDCRSKTLAVMEDRIKSSPVPECRTDSVINSDSQSTAVEGNSGKKVTYVKRRSYQLVATSNSDGISILGVDNSQSRLSDGYYKNRENQLFRASPENDVKRGNENSSAPGLVPRSTIPKISTKRQSGYAKNCRSSKFSFVWKLHDKQSSEKLMNSLGPRKVFPPKRAAYWRSLILGMKPSHSNISQKLLVLRKRGAIYTRSRHGYSLRMSKVLSVGGSSLKWSKSIERNSRKAEEEATRAVAAAEKRKKEENCAVHIALKSRNHVSRERIFRIGSDRYKMDPTRRTLQRIADKESSSSVAPQSKKNVKRSYIPRRLLIGNEEYVRIGNGNQLVRDPKKRVRVLASEKVRWSLRTARLRLARKSRYCQFFTRFGKCNKDGGKCPYIHDPSKIVVCTKFLTGSCTNSNCKLTHKVIPERMQDCSYFLKGSCSSDGCPYRHVHVNPDSSVCENFLRGYCADGNECQKKHTYVCPAFEATEVCPRASTCRLHHPKKKTEKKPTIEQKVVRGRYFDGGLVGVDDWSSASAASLEKLSSKGKGDIVVHEGQFPDYISLEVSDNELCDDHGVESI
ncbi:hypothetical protein AAHA92_20709 [Salvia divinorum]|uniref:C3H1-type domain-containing protein n=1 Tax=Salvia divinorum TaxID=28513 RepID=A0ABD1GI23_SALDI